MRALWRLLVAVTEIGFGASASFAQVTGELVTLTAGNPAFDDLERAAARANQSVFNALVGPCSQGIGSFCSPAVLQIFSEVQELVATAEELNTGTQNPNSLDLDAQGLANALRWTAAEENYAKRRVASEFVNGQAATSAIGSTRCVSERRALARGVGRRVPEEIGLERFDAGPASDAGRPSPIGEDSSTPRMAGAARTRPPSRMRSTTTVSISPPDSITASCRSWSAESSAAIRTARSISIPARASSTAASIPTASGRHLWPVFLEEHLSLGLLQLPAHVLRHRSLHHLPAPTTRVDPTDTLTEGDTHSDAFTIAANTGYTYRFGPGGSKPLLLEPSAAPSTRTSRSIPTPRRIAIRAKTSRSRSTSRKSTASSSRWVCAHRSRSQRQSVSSFRMRVESGDSSRRRHARDQLR